MNRWLDLSITSTDVKANVEDLKVLGKGDFKALLKWRLALRQEVRFFIQAGHRRNILMILMQLSLDVRRTAVEEVTEVVEVTDDVDEEQQISEEVRRLVISSIWKVLTAKTAGAPAYRCTIACETRTQAGK
jgi:AdoMet-dependent rRNA methyltransferase SPB1